MARMMANKFVQQDEGLLLTRPSDAEILNSAKEGNLLLRPFAAREMNMSNGKRVVVD